MLYLLLPFFIPIGLYVLKYEAQNNKKYFNTFKKFNENIRENTELTNQEKMVLYEKMLVKNRCKIIFKNKHEIIGECSKLSIGWILISVGFIYLGLIVYLIYYFFLKKNHKIKLKI